MTMLRQHIEDLDVDTWAGLTKRAAEAALDAAARCNQPPPAEMVAIAAMSEHELAEHRSRSGSNPGSCRQ